MKKFLSIALASALILSMSACTSTSESTPADTSSAASDAALESSDTSSEVIEEIPYQLGGELTPTMIANSRYNEGNKARLAKVIKKLDAGEDVTVAYLGGSITQGSSAGNDLCYARLTTNWLSEKFPSAKITYVNAGIGATGSYIGVHRCDDHVLSHDPDLVFIDFSVNDTSDRTATNKSTYESLLRKIWSYETAPAIVTIAMTQDNGTSFQEHHGEIVKNYDIPMISYKNAILDVIDKGYIKWTDISDDNIHPNVPGHAVLTDLITNYLQSVIDEVDSIDTTEPELPVTSESGMKFQNAKLYTSANIEPVSYGKFEMKQMNFGNFNDPWIVRSSDGKFGEDSGIVFEVEAMNIGILYGKLTSNGGMADIYVDDKLITTINADFTNGWGNYVEYAEICSFMTTGTHTIKIVPHDAEDAAAFYLSGLAIS